MEYGFESSYWPKTTPMEMSEALEEIWNGTDQVGPLKIGAWDTFYFNSANVDWHLSFHTYSTSFESKLNKGDTILEKFSIKHR